MKYIKKEVREEVFIETFKDIFGQDAVKTQLSEPDSFFNKIFSIFYKNRNDDKVTTVLNALNPLKF